MCVPVHLFAPSPRAPNDHIFGLEEEIKAALVEWCEQQTKEFFVDGNHELALLEDTSPPPKLAIFSSPCFQNSPRTFEQLLIFPFSLVKG
jgi:hypothetical protein